MLLNRLKHIKTKDLIPNINGILLTSLTAYLAVFIIVFTTSNASLTLLSTIFYAVVLVLIALNWRSSKNVRNGLGLSLALTVFALVIGFFSLVYLDKFLFMTIMLLVTVITFSSVEIPKKFMTMISLAMLVVLIYFFFQSFGYFTMYFETISPNGESLLNNPNGMGLIMLFSFLIVDRSKLTKSKLLRLILIAATVFAMVNYGSRSPILCLALYFAILFILKTRPKFITRKVIFWTFLGVGLLFPALYVHSYNSTDSRGSSAEVFGKKIYSGRQEQWSEIIDVQNENIITGSENNDLLETFPSKSTHNTYLNISFQLGIPFLLLFFWFMYICVIKNKLLTKKTFASIIVILVYGFFETAFEAGNANSMIMTLAFINMDLSVKQIEDGI